MLGFGKGKAARAARNEAVDYMVRIKRGDQTTNLERVQHLAELYEFYSGKSREVAGKEILGKANRKLGRQKKINKFKKLGR